MNNVTEAFKEVGRLTVEIGPRLDNTKNVMTDVMIETHPIMVGNKPYAKYWGPFDSEDMAQLYLTTKRDRNRIRAAAHFAGGGIIEHDGHFMCHEAFQYRFVPVREYYARYLAQIVMSALGGLVAATAGPEPYYRSYHDEPEEETDASHTNKDD